MAEIKLKRCPFCGGEVKLISDDEDGWIECEECGARTDFSKSKIVQKWNTRKPMQNIVERLEKQAEQYRNRGFEIEQKGFSTIADKYYGKQCSYLFAIEIVKEEGGVNDKPL